MESFTYTIPANDTLYKGMPSIVFNRTHNRPSWFSYKRQTAHRYGGFLHILKTGSPLKLIDLMSGNFHNWLACHIVDSYRHNECNNVYYDIMELLVPLKIVNKEEQDSFLRERYGIGVERDVTNVFDTYGKFVQNKNRVSIADLDARLTHLLTLVSRQFKFDGYIASNKWPSTFHGMFDDEICLFDISSLFVSHSLIYVSCTISQTAHGGSRGQETKDEDISKWKKLDPNASAKDVWNQAIIKNMRLFGYTGPIQYNDQGEVIRMTLDEIRSNADFKLGEI